MVPLSGKPHINALASLLEEKGLDASDFIELVGILGNLKKRQIEKGKEQEKSEENKIFKDKEFIYGRRDIFIYRRGETKSGNYYVRIYDDETKRIFKQSLKTANRERAIVAAEILYSEKKDKLLRGIKMTSITTSMMIEMYLKERSRTKTHIPHKGITHNSFSRLKTKLKYWEDYIKELKLDATKLEKIPKEVGSNFRYWMMNLPKSFYKSTSRSNEVINHTIASIKQVYKELAIKKGYITLNEMPEFEYFKIEKDQKPKRDILEESEYAKLCDWMRDNYATEKGISQREMVKRRVFALFFSLHYNLGARNKEMLGLRWSDITKNPRDDAEGQKNNRVFNIDASNSKTGKGRNIVASDVVSKLDRIKSWYNRLGITPEKNDYVFINLTETKQGQNVPYDSVAMEKRLKSVLEKSGMKEKLDADGRHITLYSARHFYATARLMRGVSMGDLALNMGTSITYIEKTYSHLTTLMRSEEITKGQGWSGKVKMDKTTQKKENSPSRPTRKARPTNIGK